MDTRSRTWVALPAGVLLLVMLCGCSSKESPTKAAPSVERASPSASDLREAAEQTYRNARGLGGGEGGIPPECWADPIKALHPVKVYTHRVNVVVVQGVHDGIEEGKYIYISISSYLPLTGDDGFEFMPNPLNGSVYHLGDGVFDFKRTINKP
jgi:hypothetical protein